MFDSCWGKSPDAHNKGQEIDFGRYSRVVMPFLRGHYKFWFASALVTKGLVFNTDRIEERNVNDQLT